MNRRGRKLTGERPEESAASLVIIDMINDLAFPEGRSLLKNALPMAQQLASLRRQASEHGCAVIYVNDNFGRWRSDFKSQVRHCLSDDVAGKPLAELLRPSRQDYFVLKPAHSGFYSTVLDMLLKHLGTKVVVITGIATNICVHFTAIDAYVRGYQVWVPRDCVAANTKRQSDDALKQMQLSLKASIQESTSIEWEHMLRASHRERRPA